MPHQIIIVEDDSMLRENIAELLQMDGFQVTECASAGDFYSCISQKTFNVAIIDIGLPDQSGYDIARFLRANTAMGIIILTARTGIDHKIAGFSAGADYYYSKPVDIRELSASITNLLRRLPTAESSSPAANPWRLNTTGWLLAAPNGSKIKLTNKESDFLALLLNCGEKGAKKEDILLELNYISEEPYGSKALGVMLTRLRKKLKEQIGENALINTVHGFGFSLGEELIRD